MKRPVLRGGRRTAALQMLFPAVAGVGFGFALMGTGATKSGSVLVVVFVILTAGLVVVIRRSK